MEFNRKPIKSVKTGFAHAVELSGFDDVSPQAADPWQSAGYLDMSLKILLDTYGHHHPIICPTP